MQDTVEANVISTTKSEAELKLNQEAKYTEISRNMLGNCGKPACCMHIIPIYFQKMERPRTKTQNGQDHRAT